MRDDGSSSYTHTVMRPRGSWWCSVTGNGTGSGLCDKCAPDGSICAKARMTLEALSLSLAGASSCTWWALTWALVWAWASASGVVGMLAPPPEDVALDASIAAAIKGATGALTGLDAGGAAGAAVAGDASKWLSGSSETGLTSSA